MHLEGWRPLTTPTMLMGASTQFSPTAESAYQGVAAGVHYQLLGAMSET